MATTDPNPRTCIVCAQPYTGRTNQKYCSAICRAKSRRHPSSHCLVCGKVCPGRADTKHCSRKCRYASRAQQSREEATVYYYDHREEVLAQKHERRLDPIVAETIRARSRARRACNLTKAHEEDRRYRIAHCAQRKAYHRLYKSTHPERFRDAEVRRRAQKKNAAQNDLTLEQWEEIKAAYGYRCVYCGCKIKDLTRDHITPLVAGGNHTVANIVPACLSCNASKRSGEPPVPVQPLLLTLAPAKPWKGK